MALRDRADIEYPVIGSVNAMNIRFELYSSGFALSLYLN